MNRSLKLSMLMGLALGSSQAVALELGQIHVKSALGQPLLAEIPVTPEGPADLRSLSARLAPSEDFDRAGITDGRPRVPLKFAVVTAPGGGKLIRITSSDAISDPYLDLLVEVDNASGKSVREYTILLDPPGMTAAPAVAAPRAPAASRPARSRARPSAAPAPASNAPAPASKAAAIPSTASPGGTLGPVQRGQTLSSIAQQNLPAGVDMNQMLLALQQANPDAFYRDNVNALKSGAVLRVPTASEAKATSIAAALAEVRRQNSDWRAGTTTAPTNVADAGTRSTTSSSPTTRVGKDDDHLSLLPSKSGGKTARAGAGGNGKAATQQDLLRSQESLAAMQQQGAELKSRLKALEDINNKNERLLSLKDSEIAELQRKLAAARQGAAKAAEPVAKAAGAAPPVAMTAPVAASSAMAKPVAAQSAAPPAASMAGTQAPAASGSAAVAVASKVAPAATPVVSKPGPKPVATKPAPVKSAKPAPTAAEPWYMQTWAMAGGAGAVLVAGLALLAGRRRKVAQSASGSSLADRFGAAPELSEDGEDLDQEELLDQLAEHPDDISLHLELVSLYFHRRDVEHFEAAAEAMYAHITDPQQSEWQDVAAMGEDLVPGHPLFVGVDTSVPEDERGALRGFDLDAYAGDESQAEPVADADEMPASSGPSKISEYNFDFNLTPRSPASSAPAEHESEPELAVESEAQLDFMAAESLDDEATHVADAPAWQTSDAGDYEQAEFSDDPIDTKLDLARAYLDMGDADGARAMLEEVLSEGSHSQQETAQRLLENIA